MISLLGFISIVGLLSLGSFILLLYSETKDGIMLFNGIMIIIFTLILFTWVVS